MIAGFRRHRGAVASAVPWLHRFHPDDFNRRVRRDAPPAGHIRLISSLRHGTQIADRRSLPALKLKGCTRMPFARLGLNGLIGGALLLTSTFSSAVPAAAQSAASPYSGTYVGTTQLISGSSQVVAGDDPMCTPGRQVTLQVQDGRFQFPWQERMAFHVRIAADGTFYAATGSNLALSDKRSMIYPVMQGRVSGADLVADYGTRWCRYHLAVTRS